MKFSQLVFAAIAITVTFATPFSLKYEPYTAPSARVDGTGKYRLPNNTRPLRYGIKLVPYLDDNVFTFDGEVEINVEVTLATLTITLHADQLEINDTIVTSANSVPDIINKTYNEQLQFYTLSFATALTPGNYLINIKYSGVLRDDLRGFYRSYYISSAGLTRWYASTFFAPSYARRAFPCFDEPALKATFDISIAHWENQSVISNALPESNSVPDSTIGNRMWTKFYTTPLMSTYLVAFIVSDFRHVASPDQFFKTWSRPEALETGWYSLGSFTLLNELSTYTGINYESSIPKMEQVALPFSASIAMENWGLITYSERWLLWEEGTSTTRNEQEIQTIVAHEFAHQWFGNLVTPEWWSYVWLSEGFASFFEYYTTEQITPSWRLMEQFTVDMCHRALLADSLDTSRPIHRDVFTPEEVNLMFDIISYQKGACILWMLSNVLGEPVFQTGLQIYLASNSYGTGNPDKLWNALTEANNITSDGLLLPHVDIKSVMDTWTNQKGYPIVTVTRNYTSLTQVISQERFLLNGRGSSNDTTEYRWWIPINFASRSNLNFSFTGSNNWIRAQDESVIISGFVATDWVIFNVMQTGYYRVNYDVQNWNMISEYLESSNFINIPPVTRAQLLNDAFNLARAGYLDYTVAMNLTKYLWQETDYIPWATAFDIYDYLQRMLAYSTTYKTLQAYLFSRVSRIHSSLGYAVQDGDQHVTSFLRANSHSWACRMGCPGCFTQSHQFVQNYYDSAGDSPIPVDLRGWAYCEGLRNASIDVWHFMWNRYLLTDVAGEQTLILTGLGCSLNRDILNSSFSHHVRLAQKYCIRMGDRLYEYLKYLDYSVSLISGIRSHHRLAAFNSVYLGSPFNVEVALEFLLNHINETSVAYGGFSAVGRLLENLAVHLVSEHQLVSLRAFISSTQNETLGEVVSSAQRAVDIAGENIAWLGIHEDEITRWIAEATLSAGDSSITSSAILLLIISAILNSAS